MEVNKWYDSFLENLHEIFPKSAQLTQEIMELLCLEREAVYRRLRKDVIFHADEVIKIAATWDISLDEAIGINSGKILFQMQPINYLNPTKREFINMQNRLKILSKVEAAPFSEYMEVCNKLPRPLSTRFLTLHRFGIFNWAYQYAQDESYKQFSKIILPEKVLQEIEHYKKKITCINISNFVLDPHIFINIVDNIKYFHSIMLISDEEKDILKEELFALIDFMMEIAERGFYFENKNKVFFYVSKLCIDTNYSFLYSDPLKVCRIHAFGKYDIASFDLEMVNSFKAWMNLKKRSSIQISEANEKDRIEYFSEQRQIVESL